MKSDLVTTSEAAGYLRLKKNTLEIWRGTGNGPKFLKINGAVRYRLKDLELFLEASVKSSTSEYGSGVEAIRG
jgi:hypothetical protein